MKHFDTETFNSPPKSYRPMARWWWPGLDVTKEELLREIADMDEKGFAGGEVQAFCDGVPPDLKETNPEQFARMHRYRTQFYFDTITAILEECKKRGMYLDLTSCSGWPSNGTDVPLSDAQQDLYLAASEVQGGGTRTVKLPTIEETLNAYYSTVPKNPMTMRNSGDPVSFLKNNLKLFKVTAAQFTGEPGKFCGSCKQSANLLPETAVDLTDHINEEGLLCWSFPEGDWQVFTYYSGPSGVTSHMASREEAEKPNYVVDHFSKGVISRYLDRHIGQGNWEEYAGTTLRSFFTDSLELSYTWMWGKNFLEEFKNRRGYDLTPYLMCTFIPGRDSFFAALFGDASVPCFDFKDGFGDRIRHDYYLTVADIFDEYMLGGMQDWAREHGLKSRVQCYGLPMDNVRAFGKTDIPETEQLCGGGTIDFMKLAGSAALLYQKPLATAESLVWMGQDYMTTPMKMKVASDRLFVSGINQMIYHGWPYRHPDFKYPGFYPFHGAFGSFIAKEDSLWDNLQDINAYITRGQYLMQKGPAVVDIAVYNQNLNHSSVPGRKEELSTGVLDGIDREDVSNPMEHPPKTQLNSFDIQAVYSGKLGNALMEAGYDYAHLNEECLLKGKLEKGSFCIGDARFRVILIPNAATISLEAARKCRELIDEGFPVIFTDQVPAGVPGFFEYERKNADVRELLSNCKTACFDEVLKVITENGVAPGIKLAGDVKGIQHIHRSLEEMDLYFLRSRLADARSVKVAFPMKGKEVRVLNAWNGQVAEAPLVGEEGGWVEVELPFAPYGSYFLIFGDEMELPEVTDKSWLTCMKASVQESGMAINPESWNFRGGSLIPEDNGSEICLSLKELKDWVDIEELKYFSGKGVYIAEFDLKGIPEEALVLDLGRVGDVAEVMVNGNSLPALIAYPYAADVTGMVKPGRNSLQIKITNTLRNGLVGHKYFKNSRFGAGGDRQLALSGLIGPVMLKVVKWK